MNETLSSIVADLFARAQGREEITTHIGRLRTEINKGTDQTDAVYGRFCGLLESFREVIPDEKQRYHAAIKALSTTSKLSQKEIINAFGSQLDELKILEKSLLSPLPGWRDELKAMEARAKEKRDEITKLREQMARLETEEEGILKGKVARAEIMELAEKAMKELFADIGKEIADIKNKAEEAAAGSGTPQPAPHPAPQPAPQPAPVKSKSKPAVEKKDSVEQKIEINAAPEPVDSAFEKKCPMCGGRMNLHTAENLWMCYSCAYEEDGKGDVPGTGRDKSSMTPTFAAPEADPIMDAYEETKKNSSPTKTKPCPSCKKKMYWYPDERAWRCHTCSYETRSLG